MPPGGFASVKVVYLDGVMLANSSLRRKARPPRLVLDYLESPGRATRAYVAGRRRLIRRAARGGIMP